MGVVADQCDVIEPILEDIIAMDFQRQRWEGSRGTRQLLAGLIEMIVVKMCITQSMDKISWLQTRTLGHQDRQQSIGSDIERHAEKHIGTPLIELAT